MKQFATITVIGRDKTGVIARVTNFLFEQHANIEALEEQVTRGQFSMTLQASWKSGELKPDSLRAGLETLATQLGMEIKLRLTDPKRRQRFAIMVTKETHCFDALLAAKLTGRRRARHRQSRRLRAAAPKNSSCPSRTSTGTTAPRPKTARCNCWRNTRLISSCWRGS